MNDIQGLFASDFEYKPQGKSAPTVAPRGFGNLTHNSGGTRSYRHSNSVGGSFVDDDHDQIFGGSTNNRKIHDFGGLDVFGDVFGGPPVYTTTPERSGGNDEFDDFFRSIGGAPREKTSSDEKGSGGAEEGVDSFDDLIPGFGRSSTSGDRPTSQVSRPTISTVNVTKTTSNVKEDTFVVLESTSPPMVPSSGLFRDPLEEINKLSKSGSLKDDGWPATGENSDDIFGRFEASFTSDMNNRGKDRNPLSSESYSKIPMDNSEESHQTIFNMPTVPDNIPNSVGKTESPPSNVNISPNGETNSQVNSSSTTEEDLVSPEDVWLTASEVLLSTQPTSSPPPSRPPPPRPGKGLKAERISPLRERQEKLERQQRKSEEEEGEWRYEQERERIRVREEKEREERRLEKERERIREREEKEREERRLVKERETIAREIEREREERERKERIQEEREARAREIEREREEREREERIQEEREARAREIEREREEKEREERRLEKERERETRAREIEREREENRRVVARVNKEARDRASIAARLKAERVKAERLAVEKVMSNSRERLGRVAVEKVQTGVREREASEVEAKQMAEKAAAEEREKEIRERSRIERHQIIEERAANALAEMHQREFEAQRVHTERHRIAQTVDVEIERWAAGKQGNLRALLSTLQYVLWPECGWQPVALTDLIMGASVKKVYRKATLFVHPDKVQQRGANLQQKYVAEKVFDILKEAWNKFNSEELF